MTLRDDLGVDRGVWSRLADAVNPAHQRPQARPGLVSSALATRRGEDYVIVQNPDEATYRRLSPDEFELLGLMDGTRSVGDLVVEYMMRHRRFALPLVLRLVRDLKVARMLVDEPRFVYGPLAQQLRRRGLGGLGETLVRSFLRREWPVGGVDAWLSWLYRGGGWVLYTRPALAVMTLVVLAGLPLLAANLAATGVVEQSLLVTLPMFYGFMLGIAVVHELAHALTVKAYGRVVRRGGFSVFYGSPGLFVDTQDIWMEPRRARIAVSWAGPFSGLVLGGLAGLALAAAPQGPWAMPLAVFGVAAVVVNLVQLMPLIQLDGYYVLMDWLELPNLRSRAIGFVRRELAGKLRRRERFDRTDRILTVFGVLAASYTAYVVVLAAGFAWLRAREVVVDALALPSFTSVAGAALVLALLVPLAVMIGQRLLAGGRSAAAAARRLRRLAGERRYREHVALLAAVPAVAALGRERVQHLARWVVEREVPRDALLPADGLVVLAAGTAAAPDGARLGPGDYRLPGAPGVARAATRSRVLVLPAGRVPADLAAAGSAAERAELDGFALLDGVGPRDKDTLLAHLRPVELADGAPVAPGFHLVRSGTVDLVTADGAVLGRLGPGEHLGEAALLGGTPSTVTAVAAGPTRLWALSPAAFEDVLCRYLDLAGELAETGARWRTREALRGTAAGRFLDVEVGDPAPDVRLPSVAGPDVALADFRGQRAVVLWFSRGNNCPYCRAYMRRLGADVDRFTAAGVQVLQVAPNSVEGARAFFRGRELDFPFLCDPEKAAYRLCGLHDIGGGEANLNNAKGFARAVAVGEGTQTLRAVWLDLRHAATGPRERLAHHGLAAVQQGVFLIDRAGVVRRRWLFGPLAEPPTNDELIAAAAALEVRE